MEIIPAIDIIDGKCVRLTKGNFAKKKIYNEKPLEVALAFEQAGITRLHLVDLDGARLGAVKNWKVLETIASNTRLVIDFGGGIKTEKDIEIVFDAGAGLATIGSLAIKEADKFSAWLMKFDTTRFLLGADVRERKIAVNGWTEITEINIFDFLDEWIQKGVEQVFCTDINKDGMMQGPATDLYTDLLQRFQTLHLVASGGITTINDLQELKAIGCKGAIIGKALYEGTIQLTQLKPYLN